MDIGKLFSGVAVIVDNEVNIEGKEISVIKEIIQDNNIPVAAYDNIPNKDIIPALSSASFIVLDWDFSNVELSLSPDERIMPPSGLAETQVDDLIEFLRALVENIFIPVFIFSVENPSNIQDKLRKENLWNDEKPNRIFIKQKSDLQTKDNLFGAIEAWLRDMPSVYALKAWESTISKAREKMFLDLYEYSPRWAEIIWDSLKKDSADYTKEFGEFISRSLMNRIEDYSFDETVIKTDAEVSKEELQKVVQGERYISYIPEFQPNLAYTGDIFERSKGKYYLNIRAQCDLSRSNTTGEYSPMLYCVKGRRLRESEVDYKNGALLESRNDKAIIACVAEEKAIEFDLNLIPMEYRELKDKRIGRVLPPYITRIQLKSMQYAFREGVLPIPEELFSNLTD